MRRVFVLAATLVLATASTAAAADAARLEDPNLDRSFFLPTAMTQPRGALAFSDYELLFVGLTYGVTDRFQVTGTTLAPVAREMPGMFLGNVKYRALDRGSLRLALTGGFGLSQERLFGDGGAFVGMAFAGAVASWCLGEDCHSLASLSLNGGGGFSEDEDIEDANFVVGASLVRRLSRRTKLLLEVAGGAAFDPGLSVAPGALVSYGVRFFGSDMAGDVGFVRPVGEDTEELLMGIPFVNFTYRWH